MLGVGDSDGFGVGCAIADDIELKSIIAAAVANLMVSPMRILREFALETDVLTPSSLLMNTAKGVCGGWASPLLDEPHPKIR